MSVRIRRVRGGNSKIEGDVRNTIRIFFFPFKSSL